MQNFSLGFLVGCLIGFLVGGFNTFHYSKTMYEKDLVSKTEQQCTAEKPANTLCKWEATWTPVNIN